MRRYPSQNSREVVDSSTHSPECPFRALRSHLIPCFGTNPIAVSFPALRKKEEHTPSRHGENSEPNMTDCQHMNEARNEEQDKDHLTRSELLVTN